MKKIFICILAAIAVQVSAQTQDVSVVFDWCFPTSSTVYDNVCIEQGGVYTWNGHELDITKCEAGQTYDIVDESTNDCGKKETTTMKLTIDKCSPEGAIPAAFTVGKNDDGSLRKVYFSKGNLQYRASNGNPNTLTHTTATGEAQGEWRFADNQYDFIGGYNENGYRGTVSYNNVTCYNSQASETNQNWIDVFHFGNSGYDSKTYPWLKYAGWSNADLDANHDWGQFNAISNGGDEPGIWRVLSKDEWDYILNRRENANNKRAGVSISGITTINSTNYIYGIIILPDNFTYPTSVSSLNCTSGSWDYFVDKNTLTKAQWQDLEANGAVLIPCNVTRYGSSNSNYYQYSLKYVYSWTSTHLDNKSSYAMHLSGKNAPYVTATFDGNYGCPVRLVADVQ